MDEEVGMIHLIVLKKSRFSRHLDSEPGIFAATVSINDHHEFHQPYLFATATTFALTNLQQSSIQAKMGLKRGKGNTGGAAGSKR